MCVSPIFFPPFLFLTFTGEITQLIVLRYFFKKGSRGIYHPDLTFVCGYR